jgi:hypothetical protein
MYLESYEITAFLPIVNSAFVPSHTDILEMIVAGRLLMHLKKN